MLSRLQACGGIRRRPQGNMGAVGHRVVESQARDFLAGKYGAVEELQPLGGGAWSSAYAFSHAGHALVVRFGPSKDWFEADRAAVSFSSPSSRCPGCSKSAMPSTAP